MNRHPFARTLLTSAAALAAALLAGGAFDSGVVHAQASVQAERGSVSLANAVNALGNTSRVLVIGAHPDDEDTQLIAWLARGRHVETAYLSLTRGDGGQNLIGNELGEALGIIRTQELLAARNIDGGRQFFTRAFDFGFSKNAEETLQHWPRDTVMGDVIRVVRAFRPQVIVAIFSGTPRDGHGHHQVSGILAREAYDASGDTVRFPVSAYGSPWTVSKFYRRVRSTEDGVPTRINVGEFDPLSGRSYAEIAADSRSQHKSQGFGVLQQKGAIIDQIGLEGSRVSDIRNPAGEKSIFDGIDTTWTRLKSLTTKPEIAARLDSANVAMADVRARYRANDPTPVVEPLARLVRVLRAARDDAGWRPPRLLATDDAQGRARMVDGAGRNMASSENPKVLLPSPAPVANPELWNALDVNVARAEKALMLAAGVAIEAFGPRQTLPIVESTKPNVPDTMSVNVAVYNRGHEQIKLMGAGAAGGRRIGISTIEPDSVLRFNYAVRATNITDQWWRRRARSDAWFTSQVDSRDDAERASAFAVTMTVTLNIANTPLTVTVPVVDRIADPVKGELQLPVAAVPGITIGLENTIEYIRANVPVTRQLKVNILSAYAAPETVEVSLVLPKGLAADSAKRVRVLTPDAPGATVVFNLKGIMAPGRSILGAVATHEGTSASQGYYTISYDHIPTQRMYRSSSMYLEAVPVTMPVRPHIGYIEGVGDNGMQALNELDVPVERIDPATLASAQLSRFTAIVVGPRAYASNEALVRNNAKLLDYAKKGGTLIVQYGQTEMMKPGIMPYPIQLARTAERVTVEEAPVTILTPNSGLLNTPNKIGPKDWEGWVQERATYMPTTFDKNYSPVLQMNDPGEPPNKAGLLVSHYGKGTYVYVTLALFRQLPSGVPGAARILMNLISATPATTTPRME